jgi:hypothetical protein
MPNTHSDNKGKRHIDDLDGREDGPLIGPAKKPRKEEGVANLLENAARLSQKAVNLLEEAMNMSQTAVRLLDAED